jgi:hypothetical protein
MIVQQPLERNNKYWWLHAIIFFVSPVIQLCWPSAWLHAPPTNLAYYHMMLTVYFSFATTNLVTKFLENLSTSSLYLLEILFTALHTILWAAIGMWHQSVLWGTITILLFVISFKHLPGNSANFTMSINPFLMAGWRLRLLSIFYGLLGLFVLAGPVLADWTPVQEFIRWHPYNIDTELIWRGIFLSFIGGLFYAATNLKRHLFIVIFFICHGAMHGLVMLIDNRLGLDGNGDSRHFIEIGAFLFVSLLSLFCIFPELKLNNNNNNII